jgi:GNAT superfamily N-acetyltransferase
MNIRTTNALTSDEKAELNQLWNEEYPVRLKDRFNLLLERCSCFQHYIIQDEQGCILAWAVDFERDGEVRFSIIVSSEHQRKGYGAALLRAMQQNNSTFYGWVIDHDDDLKSNGAMYKSPLAFYLKNGFEVLSNERIDNEMLRAVKVKWSNEV